MTTLISAALSLVLAAPATYVIQEKPSTLYVQVFKASGVMSGLAHDHVIRAGELSGKVTFDPEDPSTCKVTVTVPVQKLVVDEPKLRKQVGYSSELDDDDRAKVRESMLAEDQLDGAAHPAIRFNAEGCVKSDKGYDMAGTLEIRGKRHNVEVPMQVELQAGRLRARGTFRAKHTDFGIEPYTALLGSLRNRDAMTFVLDVTATAP